MDVFFLSRHQPHFCYSGPVFSVWQITLESKLSIISLDYLFNHVYAEFFAITMTIFWIIFCKLNLNMLKAGLYCYWGVGGKSWLGSKWSNHSICYIPWRLSHFMVWISFCSLKVVHLGMQVSCRVRNLYFLSDMLQGHLSGADIQWLCWRFISWIDIGALDREGECCAHWCPTRGKILHSCWPLYLAELIML